MANELQVRQRKTGVNHSDAVVSRTKQAGVSLGAPGSRHGLQVGPTGVLVISLAFVGTVVLLHLVGKLTG